MRGQSAPAGHAPELGAAAVTITVRVGAAEVEPLSLAAHQLEAVLQAVDLGLRMEAGRGCDGCEIQHAQQLLLRASNDRLGPDKPKAAGALGLWLAFNHPRGGYRAGVAEAIRRHGAAHVTVQTDRLGRAWGFAVAERPIDMTHLIQQALKRSDEVSFRAPRGVQIH